MYGVHFNPGSRGQLKGKSDPKTRLTEEYALDHAPVSAGLGFIALPQLVASFERVWPSRTLSFLPFRYSRNQETA